MGMLRNDLRESVTYSVCVCLSKVSKAMEGEKVPSGHFEI